MYNQRAIVRVEYFKAKGNVMTTDGKGLPNVILIPVCGKMPNQAQVLAGSIAIGNRILNEDGSISSNLQQVHITEGTPDPTYGRQFNVAWLSNVDPMQLDHYEEKLGKGIVEITKVSTVVTPNAGENVAAAENAAKGLTPKLNTSSLGEDTDAGKGANAEENTPKVDEKPQSAPKASAKA